MKNTMTFGEVLEATDKLSLEEQETLVDTLHRRMIERRRTELAKDIKEAQHDLVSAAQTSLDFWDNPYDDEDWNDA